MTEAMIQKDLPRNGFKLSKQAPQNLIVYTILQTPKPTNTVKMINLAKPTLVQLFSWMKIGFKTHRIRLFFSCDNSQNLGLNEVLSYGTITI